MCVLCVRENIKTFIYTVGHFRIVARRMEKSHILILFSFFSDNKNSRYITKDQNMTSRNEEEVH